MLVRSFLIILLVGLSSVKTTEAAGGLLGLVTSLILGNSQPPKPQAVKPCGVLKDGKQYYIKSADGRYALLDSNKQLAFVKDISPYYASRFTAVQKSCNGYGLCVGNVCMARCNQCTSDVGDMQTVKFHTSNPNATYSEWKLTSTDGKVGGPYNLQADASGYLTYKKTPSGDDQLTLSTSLTSASQFTFVEVQGACGFLKNGTAYWILNENGMVVYDAAKQLTYIRQVPPTQATKFFAVQKDCDLYGFCADDGHCMSRCNLCSSDLGDDETVKMHTTNTNFDYSQWRLNSLGGERGSYFLRAENHPFFITAKKTSKGDYQLTLSSNIYAQSKFIIVDAK